MGKFGEFSPRRHTASETAREYQESGEFEENGESIFVKFASTFVELVSSAHSQESQPLAKFRQIRHFRQIALLLTYRQTRRCVHFRTSDSKVRIIFTASKEKKKGSGKYSL